MIPAVLDPGTQSPGEKEVFRRLRDDPGTADWIVLHSFDLPRHKTQVRGEADFVVLAPGLGMLCLEVKAHHRVARDADGRWRLGNDPPTSRSPFRQASDNMHSLLGALRARRKAEADAIIAWSAVLFTHAEFRQPAVEWHTWEAIDKRAFHSRPIAALVEEVLQNARGELPHKALEGVPTLKECEAIATALRPRFEILESASERRSDHEAQLREFTEEQFAALDGMSRYARVIFEGPAGTGKTVLALEAARREAAQGRRVGLLCFNRLLGDWLRSEAEALGDLVTTSTLHQLMLRAARIDRAPTGAGSSYFEDELPDLATEALLEGADPPLFDTLVIDEAQDVLRPSYTDFLDLTVEGGISAGRWTLFGDFERQAIFDAATISLDEFLEQRAQAPVFGLRVNCRNTPRIARWVTMLAHLDPAYSRIRRPDEGPPPRTRYFRDADDQQDVLAGLLDELYASGYEGRDISVLSFRKDSAASRMAVSPWRDRLKRCDDGSATGNFIRWSTVQAFKGLEARVVILTDVDEVQGERAQSLFYTAVTRPTERLYVLADEVIADQMVDLLEQFQPEPEPDAA